jgi:hypothetical protein
LNTIKPFASVQNENSVSCIARTRPTKTLCRLLSIDRRLPKLDVVGSIPISRSILSITYGQRLSLCSVCAPFIIFAPLSYWKCIANCHIECSVRRSSAAIPVDAVYQALTHCRSAHDCQLCSEQLGGPTGANLSHDRAERLRSRAGEPKLHFSQLLWPRRLKARKNTLQEGDFSVRILSGAGTI